MISLLTNLLGNEMKIAYVQALWEILEGCKVFKKKKWHKIIRIEILDTPGPPGPNLKTFASNKIE